MIDVTGQLANLKSCKAHAHGSLAFYKVQIIWLTAYVEESVKWRCFFHLGLLQFYVEELHMHVVCFYRAHWENPCANRNSRALNRENRVCGGNKFVWFSCLKHFVFQHSKQSFLSLFLCACFHCCKTLLSLTLNLDSHPLVLHSLLSENSLGIVDSMQSIDELSLVSVEEKSSTVIEACIVLHSVSRFVMIALWLAFPSRAAAFNSALCRQRPPCEPGGSSVKVE